VNVVRANEILLYVRSDGVVAAQGDEELVLYTPPDGVSYVVGGATQMGESTVGVLARSDGVLDVVWLYGELRGQIATQIDLGLPSGVVPVKVARGGSRSAVLDSAGEVHFFVVDGSLSEVDRVLRRVPRLPDGVRFTDVYLSGSASLFARSDGAVVSLGDAPRSVVWAGSGAVTRFAKGVKPLKFLRGGVLLLSDGNLQAMLYKDVMNENKEELGGDWVAKLGKGWAFVDGVSWRSTPAYGAARLSGRAVSSVGQVVVPSGDQGRVRVDVVSRGGLKGGKVVVRLGDAVVGKATVTSSSRVWVTLDRGKLSVSKQNRLTAQFMGNANAAKSAKVAFRLPPIRPGSK
jgi:hypothetical protein